MKHRQETFVSASDLAKMGYCERQVAFDATLGRQVTPAQRAAQRHGLREHAAFFTESQRIAAASAKKGKCFVATAVLGGDCQATRDLRAFRDLFLRRSTIGRRMVRVYYRLSPRLCDWVQARPAAKRVLAWLLVAVARLARSAIRAKVRAS